MLSCWCCGQPSSLTARLAPFPFHECARCGFAFRDDVDEAGLSDVYAQGDYEERFRALYLESLTDRRRDAQVRLAFLPSLPRRGRLLDVGAAGGAFVAEAGDAGFSAEGIEASPGFAALARDVLGVDVRTGTIESAHLDEGAFDVVTMWHVLEHIPTPIDAMRRLRAALGPGGVLTVEVPNAGGVLARRQGSAWGSLQPDVHVGQYTPTAIRALLTAAGFVDVRVSTTTIAPYLTPRARLAPRYVAHRVRAAWWLRSGRGEHPTGHELLRAVATAPSSADSVSAA